MYIYFLSKKNYFKFFTYSISEFLLFFFKFKELYDKCNFYFNIIC